MVLDKEGNEIINNFFYEDNPKLWKSTLIEKKRTHLFKKFGNENISYFKDIITNFNVSYKDKSILIICGGPTSKKIALKTYNYDYVWSTNRCDLLNNVPNIDLYCATRYVLDREHIWKNKEYQTFLKEKVDKLYFTEFTQKFLFNNHQITPSLPNLNGDFHLQNIIGKEKTYWGISRMASILGIGPKLILNAIYAGAKNIYVVGIDGYTKEGINLHSFEENKLSAASYKSYGVKLHYECMEEHYKLFYDYILELQKEHNFNFINLAEDYPDISTFGRITKEHKL